MSTEQATAAWSAPGNPPAETAPMPAHSGEKFTPAESGAAAAEGFASLVCLVAWMAVAVIVAGCLLVVLKANPTNGTVLAVHGVAHRLIRPFAGLFTLHNAGLRVGLESAIGASVYLSLGYAAGRLVTLIATIRVHRRQVAS
ncbi:MAG: hypothetical protein ACJ780_03185 [Solirubrobacteraceae bacterium]